MSRTPGEQAAADLVLDCFVAALAKYRHGLVPDVMSLMVDSVRLRQQGLPEDQHQAFDDAIRSWSRRLQLADFAPTESSQCLTCNANNRVAQPLRRRYAVSPAS